MKTYTLDKIYTSNKTDFQKKRYENALIEFEKFFGVKAERFFSAPGRSEIGGNHTDHNCGCVLAAGVSLDIIAMVVPSDDKIISIKSEGFPLDSVDISDLEVHKEEENSSAALIRGIACGFVKRGYKIGGFKAYTTSNVLKGSGLSSSAAFEVLIGTILNGLYNEQSVSDVEIAQIAQYAENVYFGKPSGLMDQTACSVGGFITIDFADNKNPVIKKINFDLNSSGCKLCIVDTKGSHADLTPEYAAIPDEMKSVAKFFGKNYLREIDKKQLIEKLPELRIKCGDRAVLRALHFFDDNDRVIKEAEALNSGNFNEFLRCINESGNSSLCYLQNIFACSAPSEQGVTVALYLAKSLLDGQGACRVQGGGFAGTIEAFVPEDKLELFIAEMERVFGGGACHVLTIRPAGGVEIIL